MEKGIIFILSIDIHTICEPIQYGDLGIRKLLVFNQDLANGKWIICKHTNQDSEDIKWLAAFAEAWILS